MTARRVVGYKMVRPDGTSYRDGVTLYEVGRTLTVEGPRGGDVCGVGLHLCPTPEGPLTQNASYPWRLLQCSYLPSDVLAKDGAKIRVRRLRVDREMDPWDLPGLPGAARVGEMVRRWSQVRLRPLTPEARDAIGEILRRYTTELTAADAQHRGIPLTGVRYYSIEEWASVRDSVLVSVRDSVCDSVRDSFLASVLTSVLASVWDSVLVSVWDSVRDSVCDSVRVSFLVSVRDSVWDSVRDSLWDSVNPFTRELEIAEVGAVLVGIDGEGIAHVVAPSAEEARQ